jgi:hypothetical protein
MIGIFSEETDGTEHIRCLRRPCFWTHGYYQVSYIIRYTYRLHSGIDETIYSY